MKKRIIVLLMLMGLLSFYIYRNQGFNTYLTSEPVQTLSISSSSDHQISEIDDFNLSSIWITITYQSGKKEQVTLSKDMISRKDYQKLQQPGNHTIKVNIGNKDINVDLLLYDQNNLHNQKIYFYDNDNLNYFQANTVYDIETPYKENLYFYNWYTNEERTIKYEDFNNAHKVVKLYANFTDEVTYRVRFFHQGMLIYEEYVKKGGYATPPIMSSFDNYKFIGWDKRFADVQENLDVHSIYAVPGSKMVYYNHDDSVFSQVTVSGEFLINDPILPNHDGYVFKGWMKVKNPTQNIIEAHPIFQLEQVEVRFYKYQYYYDNLISNQDYIHKQVEFLYSTWVTKGASLTCHYEVDGYRKTAYSIGNLDEKTGWNEKDYTTNLTIPIVTSEMEICVLYKIQRYYSYVIGETVTGNATQQLPFDDQTPDIIWPSIGNHYSPWIEVDNNFYERVYETGGENFFCETDEYGKLRVNYLDFCIDPTFCIGNKVKKYVAYEWYYDQERTNKINDFSTVKFNTPVYGKQVDIKEYINYSHFEFHKTTINGIEGYKAYFNENFLREKDSIIVPETYHNLPVIEFEISPYNVNNRHYIYLSKNIMSVYIPKFRNYEDSSVFINFFVDGENLYFDSIEGTLITKSGLAIYQNNNK